MLGKAQQCWQAFCSDRIANTVHNLQRREVFAKHTAGQFAATLRYHLAFGTQERTQAQQLLGAIGGRAVDEPHKWWHI